MEKEKMPRLIDAEKLEEYKASGVSELTEWQQGWNDAIYTIMNETPTIDAELVVRCDDCIYRDGKTPGQPNILCWQMHVDDFCSYGTKREVGTYCEDIVSVVRCKDCMHYKYENHLIGTPIDPPYGFCGTINRYIPETFYCAYGERREDV